MTPTQEQVAQWAREVGGGECLATRPTRVVGWKFDVEELYLLVLRAMAAQAEADAKLCDREANSWPFPSQGNAATSIAATVIRANAPKVNE